MVKIVAAGGERAPPVRTRAVGGELRERERRGCSRDGERRIRARRSSSRCSCQMPSRAKISAVDDGEMAASTLRRFMCEKITARSSRARRASRSEEADLLAEVVRIDRRLPEQSLQLARAISGEWPAKWLFT